MIKKELSQITHPICDWSEILTLIGVVMMIGFICVATLFALENR